MDERKKMGQVINRVAEKSHQIARKNERKRRVVRGEKKSGRSFWLLPLFDKDEHHGFTVVRGWDYFFFLAAFLAGFFAAAFFAAGFLAAGFFAASFLAGIFAAFLIAIDNPPFPCAVAHRRKFCTFRNDESHHAACGVNNL
jgi:hypothetical protein